MDLTEFLLARIAEREVDAKTRPHGAFVHASGCYYYEHTLDAGWYCDCDTAGRSAAFLLAECGAIRRILAMADNSQDFIDAFGRGHPKSYYQQADSPPCLDVFIRINQLLALPYADHPDYREGWRP